MCVFTAFHRLSVCFHCHSPPFLVCFSTFQHCLKRCDPDPTGYRSRTSPSGRPTCCSPLKSSSGAALPAACYMSRGTTETMQPCPLHLHVVSSVPHRGYFQVRRPLLAALHRQACRDAVARCLVRNLTCSKSAHQPLLDHSCTSTSPPSL